MTFFSELSTPDRARDHARAQAGTTIRAMPTIPASAAVDLPDNVEADEVVWDETIALGEYCGRILKRGTRIRITNLDGDACVSLIAFNADATAERLNVADTVKVQWNAYLGKGRLLLSDMGRVLLSIVDDTSGRHDALCGASNERANARKYGAGENHGKYPNARDRFLSALTKFGLGRGDIPPCVNLFKRVDVRPDGGLAFDERPGTAGEHVVLRAEMNVLLALANAPHVLDPRGAYAGTDARITAWRGPVTAVGDPIRNATPESTRAFQNVEDYFLG